MTSRKVVDLNIFQHGVVQQDGHRVISGSGLKYPVYIVDCNGQFDLSTVIILTMSPGAGSEGLKGGKGWTASTE